MSGMFGGSSAKTDRGNQLAATQGNWNIFNWALPTGQQGQQQGQQTMQSALGTLNNPIQYWNSLLSAGRTETANSLQPVTQSVLDQANATRNQAGAFGTNRQGGAAQINRQADFQTQKTIDDIISQGLMSGRTEGAKGLTAASTAQANIGNAQLENALRLLGLSSESINAILKNATESRPVSQKIHDQAIQDVGSAVGQIASAFLMA